MHQSPTQQAFDAVASKNDEIVSYLKRNKIESKIEDGVVIALVPGQISSGGSKPKPHFTEHKVRSLQSATSLVVSME